MGVLCAYWHIQLLTQAMLTAMTSLYLAPCESSPPVFLIILPSTSRLAIFVRPWIPRSRYKRFVPDLSTKNQSQNLIHIRTYSCTSCAILSTSECVQKALHKTILTMNRTNLAFGVVRKNLSDWR